LFGIDPSEYYAIRFLYEVDVEAETASKAVTSSIIYQRSEFLIHGWPRKEMNIGFRLERWGKTDFDSLAMTTNLSRNIISQ
jgi:hypothetical protein